MSPTSLGQDGTKDENMMPTQNPSKLQLIRQVIEQVSTFLPLVL